VNSRNARLWAFWTFASLFGVALATAVGFQLARLRWPALAVNALFGCALGLPQWWLLRPYYPRASLWIVATAVGVVVGALIEPLLRPVLLLIDRSIAESPSELSQPVGCLRSRLAHWCPRSLCPL